MVLDGEVLRTRLAVTNTDDKVGGRALRAGAGAGSRANSWKGLGWLRAGSSACAWGIPTGQLALGPVSCPVPTLTTFP